MNWAGIDTLTKGHNWAAWKNTLGYRSPTLGGFDAGLQTALGGQPGNTSALSQTSLTLSYTRDALNVRAIYDDSRDANGQLSDLYLASKEAILGATYKIDAMTLFVGVDKLSAPDASAGADTGMDESWIGLTYAVNSKDLLRFAVYTAQTDVTNAQGTLYAIGWDHKVNNTFSLWASAAVINNNDNANFSAIGYWQDTPAYGATQKGINAGFIYEF